MASVTWYQINQSKLSFEIFWVYKSLGFLLHSTWAALNQTAAPASRSQPAVGVHQPRTAKSTRLLQPAPGVHSARTVFRDQSCQKYKSLELRNGYHLLHSHLAWVEWDTASLEAWWTFIGKRDRKDLKRGRRQGRRRRRRRRGWGVKTKTQRKQRGHEGTHTQFGAPSNEPLDTLIQWRGVNSLPTASKGLGQSKEEREEKGKWEPWNLWDFFHLPPSFQGRSLAALCLSGTALHPAQIIKPSFINVRRACMYGKSLYLHCNNTPLTVRLKMKPNQRALSEWGGGGSL